MPSFNASMGKTIRVTSDSPNAVVYKVDYKGHGWVEITLNPGAQFMVRPALGEVDINAVDTISFTGLTIVQDEPAKPGAGMQGDDNGI